MKLERFTNRHKVPMEFLGPIRSSRMLVLLALIFLSHGIAYSQDQDTQPSIRTYKTVDTTELKAHIFTPGGSIQGKLRPAIVLLHGGGWNAGSPEWVYGDAKRYARSGIVAIAGEYRLSDQKSVTPLEAMADARDLIRWVRENAKSLGVDPHRIAVYGVSAGGHLAAAAAVFPHEEDSKTSASPRCADSAFACRLDRRRSLAANPVGRPRRREGNLSGRKYQQAATANRHPRRSSRYRNTADGSATVL